MSLVAAKCTQCGANIEVDDSHEAGICRFCGTPFVTEKAINNYNQSFIIDNATINIQGVNVSNLLLRAQQFELQGNTGRAREYYNKVLDVDINNPIAKAAMKRFSDLEDSLMPGKKVPVEIAERIDLLLQTGEKIKGITELRAATGAGLKETKDAVDAYMLKKGYSKDASDSGQSGCYIATCVYGSYDCPQVWTLRRFRDYTLNLSWYGRGFVKSYYAISPTLVKLFGRRNWFKRFWKRYLDGMVARLNEKGVTDTRYWDKR